MTGILSVVNGESRINGVLLARDGSGDPFGNATQFLSDNDCEDGDCVTVTGTQKSNGFFISTAVKESDSKCGRGQAVTEAMAERAAKVDIAAPAPAKAAPVGAKAKRKISKTPKKKKSKTSRSKKAGGKQIKKTGGKRTAKRTRRGRGK